MSAADQQISVQPPYVGELVGEDCRCFGYMVERTGRPLGSKFFEKGKSKKRKVV